MKMDESSGVFTPLNSQKASNLKRIEKTSCLIAKKIFRRPIFDRLGFSSVFM